VARGGEAVDGQPGTVKRGSVPQVPQRQAWPVCIRAPARARRGLRDVPLPSRVAELQVVTETGGIYYVP
jgi:hypothetical protein